MWVLSPNLRRLNMKKRFVVRKYVMAETAAQAIKKEKGVQPDSVYIDEVWLAKHDEFEGKAIRGFGKK